MIKTTLIALLLISATYCAIDKDTCLTTDVDGRCIACAGMTFVLTKSDATPPVYQVKEDCAVDATKFGNKATGTGCGVGWFKIDNGSNFAITGSAESIPGDYNAELIKGNSDFVAAGSCWIPTDRTKQIIKSAVAGAGDVPADAPSACTAATGMTRCYTLVTNMATATEHVYSCTDYAAGTADINSVVKDDFSGCLPINAIDATPTDITTFFTTDSVNCLQAVKRTGALTVNCIKCKADFILDLPAS